MSKDLSQQVAHPLPFIGIVTVLYRSDSVLEDFYASLKQQTSNSFRSRLYVIDNSPESSGTEMSRQLARHHGIDVVCIFNNSNVGVAAGNNQGIRLALADGCSHVLLANNDTAFPAGTVAGLLATLMHERAEAITPKIYYYGAARLLWYAGAPFSSWTIRGPHRGMLRPDKGQFDQREDTEYAPTCFMLVTSAVFLDTGLMDEQYFCYYDDTDFVFRLRQSGGRLIYEPAQTVDHKVSTSTGGDESPFSLFYMNRNRIYFARKNLRGIQKAVALTYIMLTRLPRTASMGRLKAGRVWAGVREGWRLPLRTELWP